MTEILDAWTDAAARLDRLAETEGVEPPLGDVTAHEHDVRGALGRPGARDSAAVWYTSDRLLSEPSDACAAARDGGRRPSIAAGPTTEPKSGSALHDSRRCGGERAAAVAPSSPRWTGRRTRLRYSITCTCSARPTLTSSNSARRTA